MKVIQNAYQLDDHRKCVDIVATGCPELSFCDGEPEDNTLGRNFNGVYSIVELMRAAHEAGKRGEPFEIEKTSKDPEDV